MFNMQTVSMAMKGSPVLTYHHCCESQEFVGLGRVLGYTRFMYVHRAGSQRFSQVSPTTPFILLVVRNHQYQGVLFNQTNQPKNPDDVAH